MKIFILNVSVSSYIFCTQVGDEMSRRNPPGADFGLRLISAGTPLFFDNTQCRSLFLYFQTPLLFLFISYSVQ
jgi:hypothetical protein